MSEKRTKALKVVVFFCSFIMILIFFFPLFCKNRFCYNFQEKTENDAVKIRLKDNMLLRVIKFKAMHRKEKK